MVRLLYILTFCALCATCCILGLWRNEWKSSEPRVEAILSGPSAVDRFRDLANNRSTDSEQVAPLVAAAQEFAGHLNPPPPPVPAVPELVTKPPIQLAESKPTSRPVFPAISFTLVATSYYEGRPEKSMALLSQPGNGDAGRWVREGTQVGHFTVHEIRQGVVVLRDGDNVRELAVERTAIQRNLVKEVRPGTKQAKAIVTDSNE